MKKILKIIIALVSMSIWTKSSAQKDTVRFSGDIGLNGRMQTGNLSQLGVNPNASAKLDNNCFNSEVNASYQYLKVNGFNAINDFWTRGLFRYKQQKRFFVTAAAYYGFAKSYKIEQSIMAGVGIGANVYKKSQANFLQVHIVGGYFDIKFDSLAKYQSHTLATIIKWMYQIDNKLNVSWELETYHPGLSSEYWGGAIN